MNIAIIGAGAMGSLFAIRLAGAGHSVSLVETDPVRRAWIDAHGLTALVQGRVLRAELPCYPPEDLPPGQDILLLLTKFSSLRAALLQSRHALAPDGFVAVLSNGLAVGDQLADLVRHQALVLGVTDVAADIVDGIVHNDGTGSVRIGSLAAGGARCVDRLHNGLHQAGFQAEASADIRSEIWQKVAFNAAFNALAAIIDTHVGGLDNPSGRWIVEAVLAEAVAVAQAQGCLLDEKTLAGRVDAAFDRQADHLPSMVQDRRAGRTTEVDAINGALVLAGEALNVPAPVNRTLWSIMRLKQG